MIENELIRIWQSSANQERVKFEKSRLMIDVQSTMDQFHKGIKQRDLREMIGGAIGIPLFAYYAYDTPFILTKIASVLIILWGIFVFIRLQHAKKSKPGAFSETYLEYLHKTRDYLKVQKELLENILYWYILPATVFIFLFILGPGITGRLNVIAKFMAIIFVMAVVIYYLNKRAVEKQFNPRLEKIDKLISALD